MGIISVLIGVAVWIALITLCMISYSAKGTSGIAVGAVGILVLAAAVVGFLFASKCYKKEDIYMLTPATGSFLNGLMILTCVILYVIGVV